jgi:hypothetical protein
VIAGTAGSSTSAVGIRATNRRNLEVRNGALTGFLNGVQITGGVSHRIESLRATDNWHAGLWVGGAGTFLRFNQVSRTGGSSVPGYDNAIGIRAQGTGMQVIRNVVDGLAPSPQGDGVGIEVNDAGASSRIEGNSVSNPEVLDYTWGVRVDAPQVLVKDNHLSRVAIGVGFAAGRGGVYRDNTTVDVRSSYVGPGVDAGGNW